MANPAGSAPVQIDPADLLELVRSLLRETAPAERLAQVDLEVRFEADLGLDSLARTELLARVERRFGVTLPEGALLAETPQDLLNYVRGAGLVARPSRAPDRVSGPDEAPGGSPERALSLLEVLDWHLAAHPERIHLYLYGESEQPEPLTYAALDAGARRIASGLRERRLARAGAVAIMLPTGLGYFFSFLGILQAGGIPVPIYPPARPTQIEEHLRRHVRILNNAKVHLLITVPEAKAIGHLLQAQVPSLRAVLTVEDLSGVTDTALRPRLRGRDIAFLQYTSGSTGDPKGVILSHADLLANIRAMGEAVGLQPTDVFVSWLPLYHDMGLIGAWMGCLYYGLPLVVMSPLSFLARPSRWLWAIHRHRGTFSASPNFGYELCLHKVDDSEIQGLDLSSWRYAFNGAEPVSPDTLERFAQRFAGYGLRADAMAPVYGLAEAGVGLAFPPAGRGALIDCIDRAPFTQAGQARPVPCDQPGVLRIVACGRPLPGYQVRVVDPGGNPLSERREGRLEFRGPSATRGYYNNPQATDRLYRGGWLDTGDRAYLAAGDVYLTGRVKDMIIRGGRNFYPYELEQAVGDLPGIRKGCVVAFATRDPDTASERLVVVAETRETGAAQLALLRQAVLERSLDILALPPDEVLLVPPRTVLKTSSGKLRRVGTRDLYEQGRLLQRPRALWWQLARVALGGAKARVGRAGRRARELLFAGYAWLVLAILVPPVWAGVALLPQRSWRWSLIRTAIRLLRLFTATPLEVAGREQVPRPGQPFVLVANHASYLDTLALIEALPLDFAYVAKRELTQDRFSRVFLERLGTVFVERFDLQRSAGEPEQFARALTEGRSLAFYPEGTFRDEEGLLPFRMGAFLAAARAGVPVLPVTLTGTRSILRGASNFPRHGRVQLTVAPLLHPEGDDWQAAVRLRDQARAVILSQCGERDAAAEFE